MVYKDVMGQLLYHAKIISKLWSDIEELAEKDSIDGYTALIDFINDPSSCLVEPVEGTKWVEITLGADSFREQEWAACHRIISCIKAARGFDILRHNKDSVGDQWLEDGSLPINEGYINPQPYTTTKRFKEWFTDNYQYLTPEQCMRLNVLFPGLENNPFDKEDNNDESSKEFN